MDSLMDTFGYNRVVTLLNGGNNRLVSQYALAIHHLIYAPLDTLSYAKRYVDDLFEHSNEERENVEGKIQRAVIGLHRILMNSQNLDEIMNLHWSLIDEMPHIESNFSSTFLLKKI